MHIRKGFTLIEVVMVIIIMAIILSITLLLGLDYMRDLQLRTEKEALLHEINYTLSYVKSTNYYKGTKFTYIDVNLLSTGLRMTLDSGSGFGLDSNLLRTSLVISGSSSLVRLTPYVRPCEDIINAQESVFFDMQSNIDDTKICFEWKMALCKIFVVSCP